MSNQRRIVVTGMGINTPIGDDLETYYANLIAGKSAVTKWKWLQNENVYSKVGGDLSEYDIHGKAKSFKGVVPDAMAKRIRKLTKKAPFSTACSVLLATEAWVDAGMPETDPSRVATIIGGHNLNERYFTTNYEIFLNEDPDYIDSMAALHMLDTDHAGSVSEVLGNQGAAYTMGGACASANIAMRAALDEIRHHDHDIAVLVGAVLDFSQMGPQAMALMGAITFESFNETPETASRPYDINREGFVPSHGGACLVLEELEHATRRGAKIYAEVLGVTSTSDGSHLPSPSPEGQARTIARLLKSTGIKPEEVDFVCAHATSTPQGDISEITALKRVFGDHAYKLKINAPKSMLGHTCWSAPAVESVAALMQMKHGKLHPSINVFDLDPVFDLEICANEVVDHQPRIILKNSFGFGGLNCCALFRKFEG